MLLRTPTVDTTPAISALSSVWRLVVNRLLHAHLDRHGTTDSARSLPIRWPACICTSSWSTCSPPVRAARRHTHMTTAHRLVQDSRRGESVRVAQRRAGRPGTQCFIPYTVWDGDYLVQGLVTLSAGNFGRALATMAAKVCSSTPLQPVTEAERSNRHHLHARHRARGPRRCVMIGASACHSAWIQPPSAHSAARWSRCRPANSACVHVSPPGHINPNSGAGRVSRSAWLAVLPPVRRCATDPCLQCRGPGDRAGMTSSGTCARVMVDRTCPESM